MNNVTRHVGMLEIVDRMPSSRNGNPRYLVKVGDRHCFTKPDSDLAYGLGNMDGCRVEATIGTHYGKLTLRTIRRV